MNRRIIVLFLALMSTLSATLADAQQTSEAQPVRGQLCLTIDGSAKPECQSTVGMKVTLTPNDKSRTFIWSNDDGAEVVIGTVAPKTDEIDLVSRDYATIALSLAGDNQRGWPAETLLLVTAGQQEWRIALAGRVVAKLRRLRMSAGNYALEITAPHHQRVERRHIALESGRTVSLGELRLPPAPHLSARVIDVKGNPIVGVAVVDVANARTLATADGAGVIDAELPAERPAAVDLNAAGYAPHRVRLPRPNVDVPLGTVTLRKGVTVNVSIDRSAISAQSLSAALLHADNRYQYDTLATKTLQPADSSVQFKPIEPGTYSLVVQGDSPFQRHLEHIEVGEEDLSVKVRIEPVTVTGEALIGDRPLKQGMLSLTLPTHEWQSDIELDDHGTFSTEFWHKGTYFGFIHEGELRSATFIRQPLDVAADPTHWHIVIPDRRITGRVFDKETGKPLSKAGLSLKIQSGDSQSFHIIDVAPDGSYTIAASDDGTYEIDVTATGYMAARRQLVVASNDTSRTLDFPMETGALVPLLIVNPGGTPLGNALVIDGLGDGFNPDYLFTADGAGRLELHMSEGDVKTLYILPRDGSFLIADVRASDVQGDAPVRLVVPRPAADLRIHVQDESGKPLRNTIPLIRIGGRFLAHPVPRFLAFVDSAQSGFYTDASGDLTMRALPAGLYEIYLCLDEREMAATLAGSPPRDPIRTALYSGQTSVTFTVPSTAGK